MTDINHMQEPNYDYNRDSLNSSGSKVVERYGIKSGIKHYRILPPFGSNHGGCPYHQYQQHFIVRRGPDGKNQYNVVQCSRFAERYCPICDHVKQNVDVLERAFKEQPGNAKVKEDLEAIRQLRSQTSVLYNAVTTDGRVVVLQLKWNSHLALTAKMQEADSVKNINPLGLSMDMRNRNSGVWFTFSASGSGRDTKYFVDFKRNFIDLPDGTQAEVIDRTPVAADLKAKIDRQLMNPGSQGPLFDIHDWMDNLSASQLAGIMNGQPVPKRQPKQGRPMVDDEPDVDMAPKAPQYQAPPVQQQAAAPSYTPPPVQPAAATMAGAAYVPPEQPASVYVPPVQQAAPASVQPAAQAPIPSSLPVQLPGQAPAAAVPNAQASINAELERLRALRVKMTQSK